MKNNILLVFMALILPLYVNAQKITLGSCKTKDGGTYQGEMVAGKPHGKGKTVYKNGDTYEGHYVMGFILFLMVKNMTESGFRTNNMGVVLIIL